MNYVKNFHKKTLKYELINRYLYSCSKELPRIKKVVLYFGCKTSDIRSLTASALALELVASQKGTVMAINQSSAFLKIKKGNPIGCKVILRKDKIHSFLFKVTNDILPKFRNFNGFSLTDSLSKKVFSFVVKNAFSFPELEKHYGLFNDLTELKLNIVTFCHSRSELISILKALQLPIKLIRSHNSMVECNLAKIEVKGSNLFVCFYKG